MNEKRRELIHEVVWMRYHHRCMVFRTFEEAIDIAICAAKIDKRKFGVAKYLDNWHVWARVRSKNGIH